MMLFLYGLAILVIVLTAWSLIPRNEWWIRFADFPRLQILSLGVMVVIGLVWSIEEWHIGHHILTLALMAALAYQIKMVLPYTRLWKKQVQAVTPEQLNPMQQVSLLVSNVLTPNQHYEKLIAHINTLKPDLVLTLESDAAWQAALSQIEADYPYRVAVPLDNLYGMHLYSRLTITQHDVKFLFSEEIPSIHATLLLRSGQPVQLYCLHPKPPSPTEAHESTLRDAELLLVADHIASQPDHAVQSCIVMGDLNDVAWSRTTRLFQRISGLLDPRVGRHFINTFHANYPFFRWSLDHVFHSTDFALVTMQRLDHIGSDHFPVYTVLQSGRVFEQVQQSLEQTTEDQQEAQEKIQEGIEQAQEEAKSS